MAGSVFGRLFTVSTFGESHGAGLGAVVDGCPAGLSLDPDLIQTYLDRRKPGGSRFATQRKEADRVEILSGVFEGKTTGTPILLLIRNEDQRSADYNSIAAAYRPGHADFSFDTKFGFRDWRGGGRSSGRETAGRVAAGAVALHALSEMGIEVHAFTRAIGPFTADPAKYDWAFCRENRLVMPDREAEEKAEAWLEEQMAARDSAGGRIECRVTGLPAGFGDPVFEKLDANLAKAVMSIGAVKGVEFGDGFRAAEASGSADNDGFTLREGRIVPASNHAGGILGGISDGAELVLTAAVKPTPSIAQPQHTVTRDGQETVIEIKGRHDPVIVPRAVVVVEAMVGITLLDAILCGMGAQYERVRAFVRDQR